MIQLYEFTVLLFYRLLLTLQYIDTLRLYGFTVNFASLPNVPFYAPKAARSDRKFRNLPFYGAFYGAFLWNNGIYHFTVYRFTARLLARRALDARLTHRHQVCPSLFRVFQPE